MRAVIPLLNPSVKTFDAPTWNIAADVTVEEIHPADFGAFAKSPGHPCAQFFDARSQCICISSDHIAPSDLPQQASTLRYLLNLFRFESPIAVAFAFLVDRTDPPTVTSIVDLECLIDSARIATSHFEFKPHTQAETIAGAYSLISNGIKKSPNLSLTVSRFNSALDRPSFDDRLVDLTIALESLLDTSTEIKFKVALFCSQLAKKSATERESAFSLLQTLYDVRSAIVHGSNLDAKSHQRKRTSLLSSWTALVEIAHNAIWYHFLYLHNNKAEDWPTHLTQLVLGTATRIDE